MPNHQKGQIVSKFSFGLWVSFRFLGATNPGHEGGGKGNKPPKDPLLSIVIIPIVMTQNCPLTTGNPPNTKLIFCWLDWLWYFAGLSIPGGNFLKHENLFKINKTSSEGRFRNQMTEETMIKYISIGFDLSQLCRNFCFHTTTLPPSQYAQTFADKILVRKKMCRFDVQVMFC